MTKPALLLIETYVGPHTEELHVYPPVACGIGKLFPENAKEAIEAVRFSKTHFAECRQELDILKRQHPEWRDHGTGMADLEIAAVTRVWNRYLKNGGYLGAMNLKLPPSSKKRILEIV